MTPERLKNLISILLIATGVLHLVVAAIGAAAGMQWPLAAFGAIYAAFGVLVRSGGKPVVLGALAVTALGLALGGAQYAKDGGPIALPVMLLIDVVVLGAGVLWLMKSGKPA